MPVYLANAEAETELKERRGVASPRAKGKAMLMCPPWVGDAMNQESHRCLLVFTLLVSLHAQLGRWIHMFGKVWCFNVQREGG